MTGRDYLTLARNLLAMTDEASWRSAVSRGYYAAFHVGRAFLAQMRFQVPHSEKAHAYLWLRLQNCGDPAVRRAGSDLHALRAQRNQADYDLRLQYTQTDAQPWVDLAELIVLVLEAAAADPARAAAIEAEVVRYERDILQDVTHPP